MEKGNILIADDEERFYLLGDLEVKLYPKGVGTVAIFR